MNPRISLRARIVILAVVAIVPLFGLSLYKAVHNAGAEVERAKQNLQFAASLAAASQAQVADSARQVLTVLASLPAMQEAGATDCERYGAGLISSLPEYTNLGIIDLDGYTRCYAPGGVKKVFLGDRLYFRDALAQQRFVVSTYSVGRLAGRSVIIYAQPVRDAGGRVTGVAFASFDLVEMAKSIAAIQLPEGAALGIQDRDGVLLAGNPSPSTQIGEKVRSPVLQEAVETWRSGVREGPDAAGQERLWALMPSTPGKHTAVYISVSMDRSRVVGPSRTQLWLELSVLALVAFLSGWVAWMIGGVSILAPTRQILNATQKLQGGHFDVRIPLGTGHLKGEFSRIAGGFNLMADSLQQRDRDVKKELAHSRQAYATLELIMNSMQDGLLAVDGAGVLLLINETASRLFAIDEMSLVLSPRWPERQGLFDPGTQTLYAFDQLPLYRALQGDSGGPLHILVRNERETKGRLISCSYRPMRDHNGVVGALMVFSDITQVEQMQMEQTRSYEQLSEVQRKLLNAQRLGRIGNWELNLVTRKIWWSDEVYELFGLDRQTFDPRIDTARPLMHPLDLADYQRQRNAAMQDNLPLDVEYRIITPAGQIRWIHQHGESFSDSSGAITLRAGVVQDITGRKLAEQASAHSLAMLRRTGEMGKIGGWEVVLDGMQMSWSEQVYLIHELELDAPISTSMALAFYASEVRPAMEAAARAAAEHGTGWDLELPLVTAKGRRIWVRTQGRALKQDGKLVRVVGALQDITQQHESQQQLRLLESSISRLNDIVMITETSPLEEPGPRIVFVNDAFERRTGYAREEVLGRSPRFLQGRNTQRTELDRVGEAMRQMKPVRAELINYKKNGEELWLDMDMVPLADGNGVFTHFVAVLRDITRRKLSELALMKSEQRYLALFESAPAPMWVVDAQTQQFLAVNEACIKRYGYSREEYLGMTIFDIRSRPEAKRLKLEIASGVCVGISRRLHQRKDGSEFHVETMSRTVDYEGRPARFVLALDMTAQVKAETDAQAYLFTLQRAADATQAITRHQTLQAAMQETVDQARAVVGAHQAIVILKGEGELATVINAVSHSDKYAHSRDFVSLSHDSGLFLRVCEANSPMRMTQEDLAALPLWRTKEKAARQAGSSTAMRGWLAVPLTGHDGRNIGLLQMTDKYEGEFSLQDQYVSIELAQLASIAIENAKLLETVQQLNLSLEEKVVERTAALERQQALFRALAEQAPQVIWNADPGGRLTYLNRKWYELMGGTPADWLGKRWMSAMHPDDLPKMAANWKKSHQSLAPYVGLRRLLAKDGTYHTMSYRATAVIDDTGGVLFWVGIDADVSEIKAIESALRLSNQELEAFSYSVSHDLRSPLNTVDGFSRLLVKQLGADLVNEKSRHYLSRIQVGVAQMGRLIEDLLSLAQVSRMQLRDEWVDISALAREIADECRVRDPERVVDIRIEPGMQARGDGRLLRVALENLLGNAWKFTSQRADAFINVGCNAGTGGGPVFFVQDNGAGFDMAFVDKLFNTFQRLHAVSEFPGTGVGLAIVSRVIGRHLGQVWAESKAGKGATFFFSLHGAAALHRNLKKPG